MFPPWKILVQAKLSCSQAIKLFETLISPIALYNAENVAHLTLREIESIKQNKISFLDLMNKSYSSVLHQRFLKFILGINKSCTNMATLGELGEFPLQVKGVTALLSFWHRVTQMPDDTLAKQAYKYSLENESFQSEWIASVKFLLQYLGLENYFRNPSAVNKNQFKTVCKAKLKEKIVEQWDMYMDNIGDGNKLRFYKTFKNHFGRELYLDLVSDFLRKIITKFRCSDHKLEIEKG